MWLRPLPAWMPLLLLLPALPAAAQTGAGLLSPPALPAALPGGGALPSLPPSAQQDILQRILDASSGNLRPQPPMPAPAPTPAPAPSPTPASTLESPAASPGSPAESFFL